MLRFIGNVHDFRNRGLHSPGQFIAGDPRGEIRVAGILLQVLGVEPLKQRHAALDRRRGCNASRPPQICGRV